MKTTFKHCRTVMALLISVLCLIALALPVTAAETDTSAQISDSFSLPVTCYWCQLQLSVENGTYIIPRLIAIGLLIAFIAVVLYKVRRSKSIKLVTAATLVLFLLIVQELLVAIGCIQIDHSSGPALFAIELVMLLLIISLGTAAIWNSTK